MVERHSTEAPSLPTIFLTTWYDHRVHEYVTFESFDLEGVRLELEAFDGDTDTEMELIDIEEIEIE